MLKNCAICFVNNISIMEVMLKESEKFSKKNYTYKLYVVKSYAKKYLLKI